MCLKLGAWKREVLLGFLPVSHKGLKTQHNSTLRHLRLRRRSVADTDPCRQKGKDFRLPMVRVIHLGGEGFLVPLE